MINFQIPSLVANTAISAGMWWSDRKLRKPLLKAVQNTQTTQSALLLRILRENANTEFGQKHNFELAKGANDYRRNVDVQSYDTLAPFIYRQLKGHTALTIAPPLYYARTSGTTGSYKNIPLTHYGLEQVKYAQKNLALSLWKDTDFLAGSVLGFASPAEEGRMENDIPYGSMSGSAYKSLSPILARKFVLPSSAFSIKDVDAKYQAYALATLAADDLTGIVAANPSSILKLAHLIVQNSVAYVEVLAGGDASWLEPEAHEIVSNILKRVKSARQSALMDKLNSGQHLNSADIWPNLSTIATWTGGSCGIALHQLRHHVPKATKIVEFGYGASEFMGSANVNAKTNHCLPLVNHHFYEFVKRSDWEAKQANFLGLHELEKGEEYYIFITTGSGLYRYDINDIVRASTPIGDCPTLEFLQKGRGVTSITGEKLSEHQVITSVALAFQTLKLDGGYYMVLADETASCYVLYLEMSDLKTAQLIADVVEKNLRSSNIEYDDKLRSGRLGCLQVRLLDTTAEEVIMGWSVDRGVREAQYKPTILGYSRDWVDQLAPLVRE